MSYVDDAFSKLKSNLEITRTETELASRRHLALRDHVRAAWDLEDDFLTGSYRRNTKTKRLKDVDIFVVLDRQGAQASLRSAGAENALDELRTILSEEYDGVYVDRMTCVVPFGSEDEIMSLEVAPAFDRSGGGYEIPDSQSAGWIATNPKRHHELSTAKNEKCDEKYVPLVKMVKGINREMGEPVRPSFLLEVMALNLVTPPFGRYQDEVRWFLATAAEQVRNAWHDPAGLGPDVNSDMTAAEKEAAGRALSEALAIAEEAVRVEDAGREREAVERWRELLGWRMTRP
jgi:hypothetical protein